MVNRGCATLDVEAKVHHVSLVHDVLLAFEAPLAGILGTLLAIASDEVVEANHFGSDETFFEVGVNDTGGARRGIADADSPGTHFLWACGEIGLQGE
jgi:hypothetical protein